MDGTDGSSGNLHDISGGFITLISRLIPSFRHIDALLGELGERIRSAQYETLRAVNKELIELCLDMGRMILEQ